MDKNKSNSYFFCQALNNNFSPLAENGYRIECFHHFFNFLLCESCVYLSLLKYLAIKPFQLIEGKGVIMHIETILYIVFIIALTIVTSLNHFMMVYYAYRRVSFRYKFNEIVFEILKMFLSCRLKKSIQLFRAN